MKLITRMTPPHLLEMSGSASWDCVSYCTSRSFSGKAVLTRLLPGDICFRSSSIHSLGDSLLNLEIS